jgi:hypothetical protein
MVAGTVLRFRHLLPLVVLVAAACDDPFGPQTWNATPDTTFLYSASRAEYAGLFSVLDITSVPVARLPLEAPGLEGSWDFAVTDLDGGLALTPSSAFDGLGGDTRARVAELENTTLDAITQAPRDTTLYTSQSVRIQPGNVYIIRSRRSACGLSSGYRYAKLSSVEIDVERGILHFAIVRNPYCDNRSFVPPED